MEETEKDRVKKEGESNKVMKLRDIKRQVKLGLKLAFSDMFRFLALFFGVLIIFAAILNALLGTPIQIGGKPLVLDLISIAIGIILIILAMFETD